MKDHKNYDTFQKGKTFLHTLLLLIVQQDLDLASRPYIQPSGRMVSLCNNPGFIVRELGRQMLMEFLSFEMPMVKKSIKAKHLVGTTGHHHQVSKSSPSQYTDLRWQCCCILPMH